jgi:diadenosine tetraphosphate (Ap4A) HIT family hydrolase
MNEEIVFQNEVFSISVPAQAQAMGHLRIRPIRSVTALAELSFEETKAIFATANLISRLLFEWLKAEGTNIIANENKQVYVDVLARKENDGVMLHWEPQALTPQQMDDLQSRIKDKAFVVNKKRKPVEEPTSSASKAEHVQHEAGEEKHDFYVHLLRRVP